MKKLITSLLMLMSVTAFAQTATQKNVDSAINANINAQAAILATSKLTYYGVTQAQITAIINSVSAYVVSQVATLTFGSPPPPVVTPTQPSYKISGPIKTKSNTTYSNLLIDLGKTTGTAFSVNGVTNVIIKNCKIINGAVGAMAISVNNSSNITIDGNLISNIPRGILFQSCVSGNLTVTNNQLQNILNSQSTLYHPMAVQNCKGGNIHIEYNHIEEIASVAPYTHDQISIYQSYGLRGDSIIVAYNWLRGGQQVKNAAGNNGACAIGGGDSGGAYQSIHDNILVNALAIAIDGTGTSLHVYKNKIYAKQVAPQPLSVGIVYFGSPGNNWIESNQINFTGPNGSPNNLNPAKSTTIKGWSTNIVNANITASILPATIITMK